jgi:hypothetical protein
VDGADARRRARPGRPGRGQGAGGRQAQGGEVTEFMIEAVRCRLRARVEELAVDEPLVPTMPKLFFSDTTIEGLAAKMQRGLPIGALWEDEGGVTLGSVGLKEDRVLGFVTSFSKLWDATGWSQDRASVDDRDMTGKRVTVNLMMQPEVLAGVAGMQRGAARTTGFLARFLICEPRSTMGSRRYTEPRDMAAVDRFTARVLELFETDLPMAEGSEFALDPPLVHLDTQAFQLWRDYHDEVEAELADDGDLIDIPDYASKSAEQACRIAACFHLFTGHDVHELLDADSMRCGIAIAEWFLLETLRVTNVRAVPQAIADAKHLWEWARDRQSFSAGEVARKGPYRLRQSKLRRDKALEELIRHGHLALEARGSNARTYHVNPLAKELRYGDAA